MQYDFQLLSKILNWSTGYSTKLITNIHAIIKKNGAQLWIIGCSCLLFRQKGWSSVSSAEGWHKHWSTFLWYWDNSNRSHYGCHPTNNRPLVLAGKLPKQDWIFNRTHRFPYTQTCFHNQVGEQWSKYFHYNLFNNEDIFRQTCVIVSYFYSVFLPFLANLIQ